MEKDFSFLSLLINETVYLVDKPVLQNQTTENQGENIIKTIQQPVVLSSDADKVLFLIVEHEFFPPEERALLLKLVETTKIPFTQVQRIIISNYKPVYVPYLHYFLIFTQQKPVFLMAERYQVFEKDNKKMLWASSLSELLQDKQQKLQLWAAMKKMFGL